MSDFDRKCIQDRLERIAETIHEIDSAEDLIHSITMALVSNVPAFKEYQHKLHDLKSGEPNGAMKYAAMGEFSIDVKMSCTACDYHGSDEECEVCGGEIDYYEKRTIDWTTCKDIYECMHNAKVNSLGFGDNDGK